MFQSEADFLTKVLDVLKKSPQNAKSLDALNELSKHITNVNTQLESWRQQVGNPAPVESVLPAVEDTGVELLAEEPMSPRSRPKTWPEHRDLATQVMEEVKKFEEWLKTTEESLNTFIGIAVPQTLNEMKSKLKEVQVGLA